MPESAANTQDKTSLEDVKRDMATLKRDLAALRNDSTDYMTGAVHSGAQAARQKAESMLDSTREMASNVADHARGGQERFCEYVRQNPTASVLIAVGVGAILGKLLIRKP